MSKENFKKEMCDYSNINEYYSYYGDVIYISSSYNKSEDYFIIVRRSKDLAVVSISMDDRAVFLTKTNRNDISKDLDDLQASLHWVVPTAFNFHVSDLVNNPHFPDRHELIKLKNTDMRYWNKLFVENLLRDLKKDHTLLSSGMTFNEGIQGGYALSYTTAENVYGSQYSLSFEWVVGNPFFDVKIRRLNQIRTRRLQYFDINDLIELLRVINYQDDRIAEAAIEKFVYIR